MRIFRFVILGLVGLGFVGGSGVGGVGGSGVNLSPDCQTQVDTNDNELTSFISVYANKDTLAGSDEWKKLSDELYERVGVWLRSIRANCTREEVSEQIQSLMNNARLNELKKNLRNKINLTLMKSDVYYLDYLLRQYYPISRYAEIAERISRMGRAYTLLHQEAIRGQGLQLRDLFQRADPHADRTIQMSTTLMNALKANAPGYLESIEGCLDIESLGRVKAHWDSELKAKLCDKYDQEVTDLDLQNAQTGDAIYKRFYDEKIKRSYDAKVDELSRGNVGGVNSAVIHH